MFSAYTCVLTTVILRDTGILWNGSRFPMVSTCEDSYLSQLTWIHCIHQWWTWLPSLHHCVPAGDGRDKLKRPFGSSAAQDHHWSKESSLILHISPSNICKITTLVALPCPNIIITWGSSHIWLKRLKHAQYHQTPTEHICCICLKLKVMDINWIWSDMDQVTYDILWFIAHSSYLRSIQGTNPSCAPWAIQGPRPRSAVEDHQLCHPSRQSKTSVTADENQDLPISSDLPIKIIYS